MGGLEFNKFSESSSSVLRCCAGGKAMKVMHVNNLINCLIMLKTEKWSRPDKSHWRWQRWEMTEMLNPSEKWNVYGQIPQHSLGKNENKAGTQRNRRDLWAQNVRPSPGDWRRGHFCRYACGLYEKFSLLSEIENMQIKPCIKGTLLIRALTFLKHCTPRFFPRLLNGQSL